ncbi:Ig-like domain-containing protein [Flavobacterium aquicola]|nr:G8 domain-containing protein [Flavobacterium aquicola]
MFFLLVQTIGFGATITSTGSGGFWDLGGSWAGGVVPTASDDVVIANGTTITVRTNRTVNNVTVQSGGVLTILNNIILTVNGSVLVNSGGQFNAGTGNNDSAIIKVFGNFTNQGTANFWKSTVVIKGDFITSGTSLQQNGNIIVGGNVTAAITGSGNGYVYPVNPYAVVSVTGTSNAQPAGTKPTDWQLINYMNEVIYGGVNCDASAGTVYSNFSTFCINDTMDFWSTGWSTGGSWSSSNPSVLTIGFVSGNSGNGRATAIASGTADVIYTVKQAGCVDKISIKKITVGAVGAISADQSICTGNNITSDITIESATGTIQWKRADNAAFTANVINLGTNSKTLTIAQVGTLNATKYFRAVVTGGTCGAGNSAIVTVTVNAAPTVPTGTASQSFCSGASPTVANLSATGTAIKWYAASSSGSALASTTALVSGTHYFATQTVNGCESTSRFDVTVTLTASVTPSVAIAITSGSNPSCSGSSVTFTATPTNGGTPTYQWTKNGTNIGGATFATYTGVAGTDFVSTDIIRCVLTPTAICVSPSTATSSGITMTVTANATPSVAIAITSGSNPSCSGSSVTFTATPTNGGTPTYQWTKNGTNIGGATSATYTGVAGTDFVSTDIIRCVLTPTAICVSSSTATSNTITTVVNPTPTITAATQPMFACEGSPATINLTGLLAGSTSTISYTINSGSVQTATGVVADPSGAASFNTGNLITADNNKTLEITGVATTSTSPSCTKSVTGITVNLNVKSNSGVISLNGLPIPSLGTTYSPNSNAVFSIDAVAGAAYSWIVPSGWSIVSGDGTNQIIVTTGTNPQGGSVTVMVNSLCSSSSLITLSSIPLPALNANSTPIKCGTLGNVTLNNLPSGNWTLTVVKDGAVSFYHESGATRTVGSLSAGTYTFTITDQFGGSASANVTMDAVTKTWKDIGSGLGWYIGTTPSSVPTLDDIVVFEGDYTISGSINACSCTVKAGVNITIAGGKVLTVENGVHVETGIAPVLDGTLTFENGASLIQNNDAKNVNTGSIIYKRTATSIKDFDYVYWSSPVAGQKLGVLSPQSDLYWSWLGDYWTTATAGETMIEGKGYIARVPRYVTSQTVNFIGTPTNGDVTIDTQGALKSNLIGNPYPSAIDAEDFMVENVDLLVDSPMLAFWTHYTPRDLNGNQYVYEAKDYSFINATGVVSADSGRPVSDGNIAAGQSFMVGSQTDGSFKFTNEMRIGDPDKNNTFFKQIKSKKTVKKEKNRIWLNLTNEGGAFKQLLVGYVTGATNDADKLFDGTTRNSNTYVDFYSIMKDKNYSIQGRGLPFDEEDQVPLGYKSTIEGTLQISIDKTDGFMTNQTVYLEDKVTNVIHDLTKGSYSFTTAKGEFKDRFILRYTNTSKLGTGDFDAKGKGVIVSVKNSQIKINSFDSSLSSVKIFDLKGSLLYEKDKVGKNEFTVDHLNSSNQFMIVMVQLEDGKWISEEIIFHD